jgi:hypothetical protein
VACPVHTVEPIIPMSRLYDIWNGCVMSEFTGGW